MQDATKNPKGRLFLIVNPHSGARRAARVLEHALPVLKAGGRDVEIRHTEFAGHAAEIVKSLPLEWAAGVCLIGGDGTLHAVLNGLMAREDALRPPLGVIPRGKWTT